MVHICAFLARFYEMAYTPLSSAPSVPSQPGFSFALKVLTVPEPKHVNRTLERRLFYVFESTKLL